MATKKKKVNTPADKVPVLAGDVLVDPSFRQPHRTTRLSASTATLPPPTPPLPAPSALALATAALRVRRTLAGVAEEL